MHSILIERTVALPRDQVWSLFHRFHQPASGHLASDQPDVQASSMAGLEKTLTIDGHIVRERILTVRHPDAFTYELVFPYVKYFQGTVQFRAQGASTLIHWAGDFSAVYPGTVLIIASRVKSTISHLIDDLLRA